MVDSVISGRARLEFRVYAARTRLKAELQTLRTPRRAVPANFRFASKVFSLLDSGFCRSRTRDLHAGLREIHALGKFT